jgi:hypothetical protein
MANPAAHALRRSQSRLDDCIAPRGLNFAEGQK